jgi:hypothetical protein
LRIPPRPQAFERKALSRSTRSAAASPATTAPRPPNFSKLFQASPRISKLFAKFFQAFCQGFPRESLVVSRDIKGLRVQIGKIAGIREFRLQPTTPFCHSRQAAGLIGNPGALAPFWIPGRRCATPGMTRGSSVGIITLT